MGVKAIMCENGICDYPVCEKETKTWLEVSMKAIQKVLKETAGAEQEWVDSVYKRIIENEIPRKLCTACSVRLFISVLVFEQIETLDPVILEWGLAFASKIAVIQHTKTVIADTDKKIKTSKDCATFLLWLTMRLQRLEYKQSQNMTKKERELMRAMRRKGESFRDLAYIFDRSVSTVHHNCQGVEAIENGFH